MFSHGSFGKSGRARRSAPHHPTRHRRQQAFFNVEDDRAYIAALAAYAQAEAEEVRLARYVELNPVRARLVSHPADWTWSSAAAHLTGKADLLVRPGAWMARAGDWAGHLGAPPVTSEVEAFRLSTSTGRPLGTADFVAKLEHDLGRTLGRRKPGRKAKVATLDQAELI